MVTYQCNEGFRPSVVMTSVCTDTAKWIPIPEEHDCIFVTGKGVRE